MRTLVYPPPGILGLGRSRTPAVIAHPLDGLVGFVLVTRLADGGVRLRVVEDDHHVIHLHALEPTSTADEVRALRAFAAVTDQPLRWHPAVTG